MPNLNIKFSIYIKHLHIFKFNFDIQHRFKLSLKFIMFNWTISFCIYGERVTETYHLRGRGGNSNILSHFVSFGILYRKLAPCIGTN